MARSSKASVTKRTARKSGAATPGNRKGPGKGFKKATSGQIMKMGQLLTENFDVESGTYKNSYSDERIAQEVGLPHSMYVIRLRRQEFGSKQRTRKPNEIMEALEQIKGMVSGLTDRLNHAENRIETLEHDGSTQQNGNQAAEAA